MPAGDGTGPAGMGPRTGRGLGFCNGYNVPGYMNNGAGFGFGRVNGRKRGFRRRNYFGGANYAPQTSFNQPVNYSREDELDYLKDQAKMIKEEYDAIKNRIDELKNNDE